MPQYTCTPLDRLTESYFAAVRVTSCCGRATGNATRGGTAGAGPARGGWPLPACGEPMRIKPHQTARISQKWRPASLIEECSCVCRPSCLRSARQLERRRVLLCPGRSRLIPQKESNRPIWPSLMPSLRQIARYAAICSILPQNACELHVCLHVLSFGSTEVISPAISTCDDVSEGQCEPRVQHEPRNKSDDAFPASAGMRIFLRTDCQCKEYASLVADAEIIRSSR